MTTMLQHLNGAGPATLAFPKLWSLMRAVDGLAISSTLGLLLMEFYSWSSSRSCTGRRTSEACFGRTSSSSSTKGHRGLLGPHGPDANDIRQALCYVLPQVNATPSVGGFSPTQWLLGKQITLPGELALGLWSD